MSASAYHRKEPMHLIWQKRIARLCLATGLLFATTAWSADALKESLLNLFGAAGEYISAGYQRTYLNETQCRKYSLKVGAASAALDRSTKDVSTMIRGTTLDELLGAIEPAKVQLRQEVDAAIGKDASAFNCGIAEGRLDTSFEQSKQRWLVAAREFNKQRASRSN